MKRVIYTVITGSYETLRNPSFINTDFDYICFTNQLNITDTVWKLIPIPEELNKVSSVKQQRVIKICPHKYLPDYDLSVYVDGSIDILGDINPLINEIPETVSVSIPKHPHRNCIYDEKTAILKYKKDVLKNMQKQLSRYKSERFPAHFGLVQSGIIIRKHNDPYCIRLMELWKDEIIKGSHRDQLSFNYCLWKVGNKGFKYLDSKLFNSKYFKWYSKHNR